MAQTLLLGLDGATFTVLDPLVARGVMPNLGRLYERGTRGTLRSIIVTGPLDRATSPALRSVVEDVWLCAPGMVLLSLAACTYIDEYGLPPALWLRNHAGDRLWIVAPRRPIIRQVFRLLSFARNAGFDRAHEADPFFASGLRDVVR